VFKAAKGLVVLDDPVKQKTSELKRVELWIVAVNGVLK
jgi:hypothetical protein